MISGYDDAVSSDGKVLSRNEPADQSATAAAALAELRGLGPADVVPLAQDLERRQDWGFGGIRGHHTQLSVPTL